MNPLEKFYTEDPKWYEKIGTIHALLERVKISEEQSGDVLQLRKRSRILSVHASTAIEGNQLTLGQVTDVINGTPVWGPPKDIKEVQNAWHAYSEMPGYSPWSVDDLLRAHTTAVDCRPFIDFMLDALANSLYKYIDVATQTMVDVPVNVPANVPANVPVNEVADKILAMVRSNPKVTAQKMALALGVTDKTIKRHLKILREQGRIQRVGSNKAGHWEIIR